MADDDDAGAGLLDHRDRDAAGMRAARRRMAILRADHHPTRAGDGGGEQREGRAQADIDSARCPRGLGNGADLAQLGKAAVHLPIADDELATEVHEYIPMRERSVRSIRTDFRT
jgi:hypothetical protein